jgi:hypothetical protein
MAPQARERSGMGRCFALGQHCSDDVVLADPALSRSPVLAQLV